MHAERSWEAALGQLQMELPRATFDTWVRDAEMLTYEDGVFTIGVQNAYARDWLEGRLLSTVKRVLAGITSRSVEVRFIVWHYDQMEREPSQVLYSPDSSSTTKGPSIHINGRYSFESFVVGPSNRLAHAASQAVAERPARAYNPLFLYGGVGLGKTHLLHAIGNACKVDGLNVLYVSSEEFTNDLVNSIRRQTTDAFRGRYRENDVLLIDDIQFIAGKEATQEEFFHTFNALYRQEKQLVISSDRPPKALVTLEERLRSRFEWGLTADIQPPDFETRLAILRAKAERSGVKVDPSYLELIARKVNSNIRELEGSLTRVAALADLSGMPLSKEMVETCLTDLLPRHAKPDPDRIIDLVAAHYEVDQDRLLSRERVREVAYPRQVAMYLIREATDSSLPQIGKALGGRDHTTVMYAHDKISGLLETDESLRRDVMTIRKEIYNGIAR